MPYLIPMIIHTLNIIFALHNQIQANTCTSLYEKNNTNTLNAGCCCAFPPLFLSFPAAECMFVFSQRKLVRQQNQDVPKHFISLGLWQIVKDYITTCQYKFATKKPLHSIIYFFLMKKKMQIHCFVNQNTTCQMWKFLEKRQQTYPSQETNQTKPLRRCLHIGLPDLNFKVHHDSVETHSSRSCNIN